MAMYKPNNFYPYQQEVDLESVEGNIFSCQVNTNGGLASGARVKILSSAENIELYENIYQFKTDNTRIDENGNYITEIVKDPYRNKDIVEFPIIPYEIYPEYIEDENNNKTCILSNMRFQSLCGDNFSYEQKKDMCPYNFYLVKKNQISYFKIIVEVVASDGIITYESIDFNDFKIESDESIDNLFTVKFNNIDDFSQYFEEIEEDNTNNTYRFFITLKNGYDYLWNVRLYEHYFDENFDEGTFVSDGYITGTTKSVFWYNQDVNEDIMKNDNNVKKDNYLEVIADSENSDIFKEQIDDGKIMSGNFVYNQNNVFSTVSQDTDGYLLSGLIELNGEQVSRSDHIDKYGTPYTIGFQNFYDINENKQIKNSENLENTWAYVPNSGIYHRVYHVPYGNYGSDYTSSEWKFLDNVKIELNEDSSGFIFDLKQAIFGSSVYFSEGYPLCEDVETHVIIKEKDFNDTTIYGQEIIFNDNCYYARVLSPLPFNSNVYKFKKISNNSNTGNHSLVGVYDLEEYKQYVYNFNDANIVNDIECFKKDDDSYFRYNCLIDLRGIYFCVSGVQHYSSGEVVNIEFPPLYQYYKENFKDTYKTEILSNNTYRIKTFDNSGNLYYYMPVKNINKYIIYGLYNTSDGTALSYSFKYRIYDKNNPSLSTEYKIFECNKQGDNSINIPINSENSEMLISLQYENPYLEIVFPMSSKTNGVYIYGLHVDSAKNYEDNIFLDKETVDFFEEIKNMYIQINGVLEEEDYEYLKNQPQKIKKYDRLEKKITLEDKAYESLLKSYISIHSNVSYSLLYKQREKITWVTKDLGFEQNINKIETENEFNINLKNGAIVDLYPTSDKNTYNSFFGVKDTDLNVENIYIRFPGYEGKDSVNNMLRDNVPYYNTVESDMKLTYWEQTGISSGTTVYSENTYTGNIKGYFYCSSQYYKDDDGTIAYWDDGTLRDGNGDEILDSNGDKQQGTGCPLDLYGTRVREDLFNKSIETDSDGNVLSEPYIQCKLFKVTSYDPNTGEFVFAGGLERIILNTDRYEVWKKESIEGSNNKYDITEVVSTYTRLYPRAKNYDEEVNVGQSSKLIPEGIKIMNSNTARVFIQPNVNFTADNNTAPYLMLDSTENKLVFNYDSYLLNSNFDLKDITIEKLDNSQWLLNYTSTKVNDLIPGMTYKLYTDWADSSPSSYFYARDIGEIELKYGELSSVNGMKQSDLFSVLDYDNLKNSLYDFDGNEVGDNYIVSGMNIYLIASIKNIKSQIIRYRYRIYDEDMELVWDSTDIRDNIMEYELKGLQPNVVYYLTFECEDEYGYEYFYEHSFYSQYDIQEIPNNDIYLTNLCYQNAVLIEINPIIFNLEEYNLSDVEDIQIYRKDSTGKILLINQINLNEDKIYTSIGEDEYKYGFVDYGVYNNEYYDYMFVFYVKEELVENLKHYNYIMTTFSIKTTFDSWSIVNIIQNQETGFYEVSGETWNFRYNLEASDIINNTSVTSWNTLGRFAQMGTGERGYDSSGLTCLLGDVSEYTIYDGKKNINKYGYHEKITSSFNDSKTIEYNKSRTNNIDKYKKWKKFCRTTQLKLLKDMAGNKWIVGISENPASNVNVNSIEQMKTISFQWMEVMDSENISIIGKLTSCDNKNI